MCIHLFIHMYEFIHVGFVGKFSVKYCFCVILRIGNETNGNHSVINLSSELRISRQNCFS